MPVFDHFADVVRLDPTDPRATVCGTCGAAWDDTVSTSVTPTPAGRCPWEADHQAQPDPVTMVQVVEFLQTISNAVNEWDDPDSDPDPWLIAETMEKFAQEIWVRNQLVREV